MIRIENLQKSFGALHVLRDINLEVPAGQVIALIGPSGSGKSTLLRCLNLLVVPDSGKLAIGAEEFVFGPSFAGRSDRQLSAFRSKAGMVFQHFNLFPHMSVLGNVMEGPVSVLGRPKAEAEQRAHRLLAKVGLSDKAGEFPSRLSGGQKQRVAIARALAMEPTVMLFDEVTSALDPELVGEVLNVMNELAHEGMTMIIVTHEIAFARDVADRVVFMRNGVVVEQGSGRQVIEAPREEATRAFLSRFHQAGKGAR